jgi:hypothetical protein
VEGQNMFAIQGSIINTLSGEILSPPPVQLTGKPNLAGMEVSDVNFREGAVDAPEETIEMLDTLCGSFGREELALYLLTRYEVNPDFVTKILPKIISQEKQRRAA